MQFADYARFKKTAEVKENLGNLKQFQSILTNPGVAKQIVGGSGSSIPDGVILGPNSPTEVISTIDIPNTPPDKKDYDSIDKLHGSVEKALKKAARAEMNGTAPLAIGVLDKSGAPEFLLVRANLRRSYASAGEARQWVVYGVDGQRIDKEREQVWNAREASRAQKNGYAYAGYSHDKEVKQRFLKDWNYAIATVLLNSPGTHSVVAVYPDKEAQAKHNQRLDDRKVVKKAAAIENYSVGFKLAEPYLKKIREKTIGVFSQMFDRFESNVKAEIVNGNASRYGGLPKGLPQVNSNLLGNLFEAFSKLAASYNELQRTSKGSYSYTIALDTIKNNKAALEKLLEGE